MRAVQVYLILFAYTCGLLPHVSCTTKEIKIHDFSDTKSGTHAAEELTKYLNEIFTGVSFTVAKKNEIADIQLKLATQAVEAGFPESEVPEIQESFKIITSKDKLLIISPNSHGLLNATYALLEKIGVGFYLTGDVLPEPKSFDGFQEWEMEDAPLTGDRFVFNWHNFLSGCTGWNLADWQLWIDQANKMRYNGIMVHAYGNNPMFSFEYLGERKTTGYLNNTASGRDWGNQHINDVRRMVGGEIFDQAVYGAQVSLVAEYQKEAAATKLMQQVFQYAEDRGTKVIFALDFDTWMATPRNIALKLPKEALLMMHDDHIGINPDHPEGYKYYRHVLKSVMKMYPQIDQLSVWHRRPDTRPSAWSPWICFDEKQFPENWKEEYGSVLKEHPHIKDDLRASGSFAYAKVIKAILKARDELYPDLEISSGSWRFQYIPYADAFYPKEVPLLPLDWEVVFDKKEAIKILSDAGKNREMYPIIWAHHDDHRYIGRPYKPWDNLSDRLKNTNSKGFGIIHWTTRPLGLYFSSSIRQVWKNSKNEPLSATVNKFVDDYFEGNRSQVSEYYYDWMTNGPIFGRETTDHFINLWAHKEVNALENWEKMKNGVAKRIKMLEDFTGIQQNEILNYQARMEAFYLSFIDNQVLYQKALAALNQEDLDGAIELYKQTDPEESIRKYVEAIEPIGFTSGEKALVFSMNTRWLVDFYNLAQALGIRPVRFKFAPTHHDSLAQGPGHFTYFVDDEKNWWRCIGTHELKNPRLSPVILEENNLVVKMTTIHGQPLLPGKYQIIINLQDDNDGIQIKHKSASGMKVPTMEKGTNVISFELDFEANDIIEIGGIDDDHPVQGLTISKSG